MKKNYKWAVAVVMIILIILVGILYFGDRTGEYYFSGSLINEGDNIKIDVIVMQNNKGNLLTYSTNIYYASTNIVAARLFYYKNDEKNIILGNSLNSYDYSRKNENKSEYGYDYIDNLLENKNNLYFDLCLDSACENILETIKLDCSKLN